MSASDEEIEELGRAVGPQRELGSLARPPYPGHVIDSEDVVVTDRALIDSTPVVSSSTATSTAVDRGPGLKAERSTPRRPCFHEATAGTSDRRTTAR